MLNTQNVVFTGTTLFQMPSMVLLSLTLSTLPSNVFLMLEVVRVNYD